MDINEFIKQISPEKAIKVIKDNCVDNELVINDYNRTEVEIACLAMQNFISNNLLTQDELNTILSIRN